MYLKELKLVSYQNIRKRVLSTVRDAADAFRGKEATPRGRSLDRKQGSAAYPGNA